MGLNKMGTAFVIAGTVLGSIFGLSSDVLAQAKHKQHTKSKAPTAKVAAHGVLNAGRGFTGTGVNSAIPVVQEDFTIAPSVFDYPSVKDTTGVMIFYDEETEDIEMQVSGYGVNSLTGEKNNITTSMVFSAKKDSLPNQFLNSTTNHTLKMNGIKAFMMNGHSYISMDMELDPVKLDAKADPYEQQKKGTFLINRFAKEGGAYYQNGQHFKTTEGEPVPLQIYNKGNRLPITNVQDQQRIMRTVYVEFMSNKYRLFVPLESHVEANGQDYRANIVNPKVGG